MRFATFTNDTTAIDHNLYVKGDRVYQSNYRSGLRILDASGVGEGRPTEVGYLDTWPDATRSATARGATTRSSRTAWSWCTATTGCSWSGPPAPPAERALTRR